MIPKVISIVWTNGLVVLGLATSHCRNDMRNSRYVDERPHRYHRWHTGVFVGASPVCIPGTPCESVNIQKGEVLHLFRCHTHTHPAYSEVWFWKIVAGEVSQKRSKWIYRMLVYKAAVISLGREIRFELKYLDRIAEAHAFNHPPRFVDFPRCHSRRQSVW